VSIGPASPAGFSSSRYWICRLFKKHLMSMTHLGDARQYNIYEDAAGNEGQAGMTSNRTSAMQIAAKLRRVEALLAESQSVVTALGSIGVPEHTYYRWLAENTGLRGSRAKQLADLETENSLLRRAASDLMLQKHLKKEAAEANRAINTLFLRGHSPVLQTCRGTPKSRPRNRTRMN